MSNVMSELYDLKRQLDLTIDEKVKLKRVFPNLFFDEEITQAKEGGE